MRGQPRSVCRPCPRPLLLPVTVLYHSVTGFLPPAFCHRLRLLVHLSCWSALSHVGSAVGNVLKCGRAVHRPGVRPPGALKVKLFEGGLGPCRVCPVFRAGPSAERDPLWPGPPRHPARGLKGGLEKVGRTCVAGEEGGSCLCPVPAGASCGLGACEAGLRGPSVGAVPAYETWGRGLHGGGQN